MAKYEMGLHDYLRVVKKRFWVILFTVITVYLFSLVYTQLQPRIYEAKSTVEMIKRTTIGGLFEHALLNYGDMISTATKVINSSRIVGKVVDHLQAQGKLPVAESEERLRQIQQIKGSIGARQMDKTNILVITVHWDEPEMAQDVANVVALVFSQEDQSSDALQDKAMRLHLEEQISKVSTELLRAERELEEFNRLHGFPELSRQEMMDVDAVTDLEYQYRQASLSRNQAELRLRQLQGALGPADLPSMEMEAMLDDPSVRQQYNHIIDLNLQLSKLLEEYTPLHPAIIDLEQEIEEAKQKMGLVIRPVLANEVGSLEQQIGQRRQEEELLESKLERSHTTIITVLPETRLQLAQLKRRVEVNNRLFMSFTERLEEMKLAEASCISFSCSGSRTTMPEVSACKRFSFSLSSRCRS